MGTADVGVVYLSCCELNRSEDSGPCIRRLLGEKDMIPRSGCCCGCLSRRGGVGGDVVGDSAVVVFRARWLSRGVVMPGSREFRCVTCHVRHVGLCNAESATRPMHHAIPLPMDLLGTSNFTLIFPALPAIKYRCASTTRSRLVLTTPQHLHSTQWPLHPSSAA